MTLRHFITTQDWSRAEIDALLERAAAFKRSPVGMQLGVNYISLLL
ncbi:MAG: N-acetylornithine carbamoyltransferase, partial [Rhodanobacteraceae bacterium]